jgi:hypothetical protein
VRFGRCFCCSDAERLVVVVVAVAIAAAHPAHFGCFVLTMVDCFSPKVDCFFLLAAAVALGLAAVAAWAADAVAAKQQHASSSSLLLVWRFSVVLSSH